MNNEPFDELTTRVNDLIHKDTIMVHCDIVETLYQVASIYSNIAIMVLHHIAIEILNYASHDITSIYAELIAQVNNEYLHNDMDNGVLSAIADEIYKVLSKYVVWIRDPRYNGLTPYKLTGSYIYFKPKD